MTGVRCPLELLYCVGEETITAGAIFGDPLYCIAATDHCEIPVRDRQGSYCTMGFLLYGRQEQWSMDQDRGAVQLGAAGLREL